MQLSSHLRDNSRNVWPQLPHLSPNSWVTACACCCRRMRVGSTQAPTGASWTRSGLVSDRYQLKIQPRKLLIGKRFDLHR